MFRRIALFSVVVLLYAPLVGSANDEKKALIHDLMEVIGAEALLRDSIESTLDAWLGGFEMEELPPEERILYQDRQRKEAEHRAKVLQRIDIRKYSAQVYYPLFERYTVSELEAAIAFYKTPAGQKSIGLIPELANAGNAALERMNDELEVANRQVTDEQRSLEPPWKRTMADIRSMATASEAYATDWNEYPRAATLDELATFITPTYIRTLPRKDGWGNEFTYIVSPDFQHYRFVSAGADGRVDFDSTRVAMSEPELKAQMGETTDPDEDIIYQDGMFVRYPKDAAPRH